MTATGARMSAAALADFVHAERTRLQIPGAVVGVRHRGTDIVVPSGITNAEHPLPVDDRTLFQVASITKTFTTTLLLTFVQSGAISLDDRVRDHLPELRLADPAATDALTIRHLLTHTAGWDGDALFAAPGDHSLAAVPARIGELAVRFAPGQGWSYNNAAFSLAGRLAEVLAGTSYVDALRTRVLMPAGIEHAFTSADEVVTHRVAAPHAVLGEHEIVLRGMGWQPGWELSELDVPAGGLITCVPELLRWAGVHLGELPGPLDDHHRLAMQERVGPAGGNTDAMGLSWLHATLGGVATFGHDGSTIGYLSSLVLVPEHALAIVTLTNALNGTALCKSVRDHVLGVVADAGAVDPPIPAAPPAAVGADLVGSYDDPFYVLHITDGDGDGPGRLILGQEQRPPEPGRWTPPALGDPSPLAWIGPDRWMVLEPEGARGGIVDVGRDPAGRVAWIRSGSRICPRLT